MKLHIQFEQEWSTLCGLSLFSYQDLPMGGRGATEITDVIDSHNELHKVNCGECLRKAPPLYATEGGGYAIMEDKHGIGKPVLIFIKVPAGFTDAVGSYVPQNVVVVQVSGIPTTPQYLNNEVVAATLKSLVGERAAEKEWERIFEAEQRKKEAERQRIFDEYDPREW